MKRTFTLFSLLTVLFCGAQPSFLNSGVSTGLSGTVFVGPKPSSPGASGPNAIWNFNSLTFTAAATASILPPSATPYASSFPAANWAAAITTTAGSLYVYYNASPTFYDQLGNNITAVGGQTYTPDPKRHLIFPFNYGNSYSDTYQCISCSPGTFTVTYDAYGTLMINGKTYNNVARVVNMFGSPYYNFYSTNPLVSIFSYDSSPSTTTSSYVEIPSLAASIKENYVVNHMNIFPNPAHDAITIQNNNFMKVEFEIYDLLGNIVKSNQLLVQGEATKVDLSSYTTGMYLIKYTDEFNNITFSKIVVE